MLSAAMNGFYGLKALTRNLPADAPLSSPRHHASVGDSFDVPASDDFKAA